MATAKQIDDRDSLESQLDGNLRTLHGRGLGSPQLHDLQALLLVARALNHTGTDLEKIEAVLRLAISDYGEETVNIEVTELWLGLKPETRNLPSSRRHVIAWEYAQSTIVKEKGLENFRTHVAARRYRFLAERLFARYNEKTSSRSEPDRAQRPIPNQELSPADPLDPIAEPAPPGTDISSASGLSDTRGRRWLARHWWLPASLAVIAVVAAVLALTGAWGTAPASTSLPSLSRLAAEAERHLTGSRAPAPGSVATDELGFGDPTPQGRTTYRYVNHEFIPPQRPTFDSLINSSFGDEQRFLGVYATAVTDSRQNDLSFRYHATLARPGDVVWIDMILDNNAEVTPNCKLAGPLAATDAYLELGIWNSPDNRLHIIRAWLSAANTNPSWVTDAVAVVTTQATTLEPASSISRELSWLSPHYSDDPVTNVESIFIDPGFLLDGNGLIGSCNGNVVYMQIGFRQK